MTRRTDPEDIIGAAGVKRLRAAGYDVVAREPKSYPRWRCPHCGATHGRGERADIFLDWGQAWHRPCVSPYQTPPSKRGDRLPMVECS